MAASTATVCSLALICILLSCSTLFVTGSKKVGDDQAKFEESHEFNNLVDLTSTPSSNAPKGPTDDQPKIFIDNWHLNDTGMIIPRKLAHPNKTGEIIPRKNFDHPARSHLRDSGRRFSWEAFNHPNYTGWIIPRAVNSNLKLPAYNHPNYTGWIIPRALNSPQKLSEEISPRNPIAENEVFSKADSKNTLCGQHKIGIGGVVSIAISNFRRPNPRSFRGCTWIIKGTTEDMDMKLDCPAFQLPLCQKENKKKIRRCKARNFLSVEGQSGSIIDRFHGVNGPKAVTIKGNRLSLTLRLGLPAKGISCTIHAVPKNDETDNEAFTDDETDNEASADDETDNEAFTNDDSWLILAPPTRGPATHWPVATYKYTRPRPTPPPPPPSPPPPPPPACGEGPTSSRILNGVVSEFGRWPWVAGIVVKSFDVPYCGGSLIHPEWVLTAAHCIYGMDSPNYIEVLLGAFDLEKPSSFHRRMQVASMYIHPKFNKDTKDSDIALLRLATPAQLIKEIIGVICPPKNSETFDNNKAYIAGWGRTRDGNYSTVLREYALSVYPFELCKKYSNDVLPSMMCAGSGNGYACEGDSGGGLMVRAPTGEWVLAGITSHGDLTCSEVGGPVFFTSVVKFVPWVRRTITNSQQSSQIVATTPLPSLTASTTPQLTPYKCRCGRIYRRIVGGKETGVNEHPWQAGLVRDGSTIPFCGASIIGRHYVLTAAHCTQAIQDYEWRVEVLAGAHHTTLISDTPFATKIAMDSIIQHPDYDPSTLRHDIALIRLSTALDLDADPRLAPVCLPANSERDFAGSSAFVAGWGRLAEGGSQSHTLQKVLVPVISNAECDFSYRGAIYPESLCAGFPEGGRDACQGDSGGPLVTETDNSMSQIGIVSWGSGCARPGKPGVYTRVTEYLGWINEVTGSVDTCG